MNKEMTEKLNKKISNFGIKEVSKPSAIVHYIAAGERPHTQLYKSEFESTYGGKKATQLPQFEVTVNDTVNGYKVAPINQLAKIVLSAPRSMDDNRYKEFLGELRAGVREYS